jgi:PEP-CTERM motif
LEGDLKKLLKISAVAMLALFAGCDRDTNEGTSAGSSYVGGHSKPVSVPEPGSLVLAGVGIVALGAFWRRGRRHVTQKQGDRAQKSRRDQDVSIRS